MSRCQKKWVFRVGLFFQLERKHEQSLLSLAFNTVSHNMPSLQNAAMVLHFSDKLHKSPWNLMSRSIQLLWFKDLNGTLPFNWWFLLVTPLWSTSAQLSHSTNGGWQSAQNWVAAFSSQSSHILCFWGALLPPLPVPPSPLPLLLPLPRLPLVTAPRDLRMVKWSHW